MSSQPDFLRFTDWRQDFMYEDFKKFVLEFDIYNPDFLDWIEHHQASYHTFSLYSVLAKNYVSQQQRIDEVTNFFISHNPSLHLKSNINFIKDLQVKYPDILDFHKLGDLLIDYVKQQNKANQFSNIADLVYYLLQHFPLVLTKLYEYLILDIQENCYIDRKCKDPIWSLLAYSQDKDHDTGILDALIYCFQKNLKFETYSNYLGYWIKKTNHIEIKYKIIKLAHIAVCNALQQEEFYSIENYLKVQKDNALEPYLSFLAYDEQQISIETLQRVIENENLHTALRFEAVLSHYLILKQQHPLKKKITQQFLMLSIQYLWSKIGLIDDYDLFDKTESFFNLDEKLLALKSSRLVSKVYRHLACDKQPEQYHQSIIESVLETVKYTFQWRLDQEKEITRSYSSCEYEFEYLTKKLLCTYVLQAPQLDILYQNLIDGLELFIQELPDAHRFHEDIATLIYQLGFNVPEKYHRLFKYWIKLELNWKAKGFSNEQVWQQLLDAEVIYKEAIFNPDQDFEQQFYSAVYCLGYDRKEDWFGKFVMDVFETFFQQEVEWIDEDSNVDLNTLADDQVIYLNRIDPELEWRLFDGGCFKIDNLYYSFFIYKSMGQYWTNNRSFLSVFNDILKYFHFNHAIYELETDQRELSYFSAHAEKFDQLNQILKLPCIKPEFFTPEAKSPEFLMVEAEYKRIISNGGFSSYIDQNFIDIPKPHSRVSDEARKWLLSMQDEMKKRAFNYLEYSDENFIKQVIYIHNLFVALAIKMVYDPARMNNVKQQKPFLQAQHYRSVGLDQQQRLAFINMIFNSNTMGYQLKLNG